MSRPNPLILLTIIAVIGAIMAWLGYARGALMISAHEGDVFHFLDILSRMQLGLEPHRDFVTPLGFLGFVPMIALTGQGFDLGASIILSQALVLAIIALPLCYVAWSRLTRTAGYAFAAVTTVMVVALTYGGTGSGLSISMHYNRWAWAIGFLMIVLALVPGRGRGVVDGILFGAGFSALVLIKATFFVALVPGVAVALLIRREIVAIALALVTGAAVAAVVTHYLGVDFWAAYVGDLLNVARSAVRPHPGTPLASLLSQPEMLSALVVALLTYFWVSRAGHQASALGLVLLVPGVIYITYQNFGNDPKWLVPFAAILLALRPAPETEYDGPGLRTAMTMTAIAAAVIYLPSAWTMAISPLRHFTQTMANYEQMLPEQEGASDILTRIDRARTMTAQVDLDVEGSIWAAYRDVVERDEPLELAGVTFPACELHAGTLGFFEEISNDLKAFGVGDAGIFTTDILTAFWLFDAGEPLQNGAPWYYGDLSGLENADYVLVPKCTFVSRVRGIMVAELNAAKVPLTVVRDTEAYTLFEIN